jgi:hypothetical protein
VIKAKNQINFILFGSDRYYPSGGMADSLGRFSTLEDVDTYMAADRGWTYDEYHVYCAGDDTILDWDYGNWKERKSED